MNDVPSLAQLAVEAHDNATETEERRAVAAVRVQWANAVAEAKRVFTGVLGREAEEIWAPEPQGRYDVTREVFLRLEDLWFSVSSAKYHGRTASESGTGVYLATDKCLSSKDGFCAYGAKEITNLADLGYLLTHYMTHGVVRPPTTSHTHYDDHGHLIVTGGNPVEAQYFDTYARHVPAGGLLPNGMKAIPWDPSQDE